MEHILEKIADRFHWCRRCHAALSEPGGECEGHWIQNFRRHCGLGPLDESDEKLDRHVAAIVASGDRRRASETK